MDTLGILTVPALSFTATQDVCQLATVRVNKEVPMMRSLLAVFGGVMLLSTLLACTNADLLVTQEDSRPSPAQIEGGNAEMQFEFPFEFVVVTEPPPGIVKMYQEEDSRIREEEQEKSPTKLSPDNPIEGGYPLTEVKGKVGPLLVPSYLPEGLSLESSRVYDFGAMVPPCVVFYSSRGIHPKQLHVSIKTLAPKERWPLRVQVKPGSFKPISNGTITGYLIRGAWVGIHNGSNPVEVVWADSPIRILFWKDGQFVEVMGTSAKDFTEEELIKVAESLKPY